MAGGQSSSCEVAKLLALDPNPGDRLGGAIALSGDTLVVGAIGVDGAGSNIGAAYIFQSTPTGWIQHQKLFAPDGVANDQFGGAVAIDGNTLVVGATLHDETASAAGAAYVFDRTNGIWSFSQKLTAFDAAESDFFGCAVDIDGDTIAIGARNDNVPTTDAGSVYVFTRSAGTWSLQQKLVAAPITINANLGRSVALSGNTLLSGANGENSGSGSASVFVRTGSVWSFQAKLVPPNPSFSAWFGFSVALEGDIAVIGAPGVEGSTPGPGIAYAFHRDGAQWSFEQKLIPSDTQASGLGGQSVAVRGERAAVSTPSGLNGNAVFLFGRSNGVWTQQQKIFPSTPASGDQFGWSVAWFDEMLAVGARQDDERLIDSGAAYLYDTTMIDCNGNEVADVCDIESGASIDSNLDGVPDECQPCAEDLNQDGAINGGDLAWVLGFWGLPWGADLNNSGVVDGADLVIVLGAWGPCP